MIAAEWKTAPSGLAWAFGGVVFDEQGRVLLRKPRKEFDGVSWTFGKGRPDAADEPPEAVALREAREEYGIPCRVIAPLPGTYAGGTTENVYFLMQSDQTGAEPTLVEWAKYLYETEAVRWASPDEARQLISQTRNLAARQRDLAVLAKALEEYERVKM